MMASDEEPPDTEKEKASGSGRNSAAPFAFFEQNGIGVLP